MTTLAHHHACPNCHERPLCREDCTTEIDDDGARRGGTVLCDRCAALTAPPSAEQKLAELRETAGALLEAMPFDMSVCPKCRGNVLATKVCRFEPPIAGSWFACDEHATPGAMDMRTAPHVRRLRALLDGRQP